jgi:hypothetical protein
MCTSTDLQWSFSIARTPTTPQRRTTPSPSTRSRRTDHRHAIERNTSEARSAAQSSAATRTRTPTKRPRPARWEHRVSSGPSALELDDKRWASHAMALHDVDADHR